METEKLQQLNERIEMLKSVITCVQAEIEELLNEIAEQETKQKPIGFKYGKWNPKKIKDDFNWLY